MRCLKVTVFSVFVVISLRPSETRPQFLVWGWYAGMYFMSQNAPCDKNILCNAAVWEVI